MQRLSQIRKLSVPQTAASYWLALQVPVLPWAQTPLGPVELHWVWTAIDLPTDLSENLAAAGPASPYRRLSSLYISAVETRTQIKGLGLNHTTDQVVSLLVSYFLLWRVALSLGTAPSYRRHGPCRAVKLMDTCVFWHAPVLFSLTS